jgi:hypothetical protein
MENKIDLGEYQRAAESLKTPYLASLKTSPAVLEFKRLKSNVDPSYDCLQTIYIKILDQRAQKKLDQEAFNRDHSKKVSTAKSNPSLGKEDIWIEKSNPLYGMDVLPVPASKFTPKNPIGESPNGLTLGLVEKHFAN